MIMKKEDIVNILINSDDLRQKLKAYFIWKYDYYNSLEEESDRVVMSLVSELYPHWEGLFESFGSAIGDPKVRDIMYLETFSPDHLIGLYNMNNRVRSVYDKVVYMFTVWIIKDPTLYTGIDMIELGERFINHIINYCKYDYNFFAECGFYPQLQDINIFRYPYSHRTVIIDHECKLLILDEE